MSKYAVGQVWRYKTRPREQGSRLYIARVDDTADQQIYHIFLDGLALANERLPGGLQVNLPHAPVDETSLNVSVTSLERVSDAMPDISTGYGAWKQAYDEGDAGAFNIAVAEIVQYIEDIASGRTDA